jgi:two-component system sensor histidine kinase GlrK
MADPRKARSRLVERYRPKSVFQLLLIGFALVMLPLAGALIAAYFAVDIFNERSRRAVVEAASGVRASQQLNGDIAEMERYARQYQILGDNKFYQLALERRAEFGQAIRVLKELDLTQELVDLVGSLVSLENQVFGLLESSPPDSEQIKEAVGLFVTMDAIANGLLRGMTRLITEETQALSSSATRVKQILAWLGSGLILAALGLSLWITIRLSTPINQVKAAIRRLGEGELNDAITVSGPRDLEQVGGRLEWLRHRLRQVDDEKIRFLRSVSHELKTPLTAIREGAELLRDQVPGPLSRAQAEVADILRENSIRLQRLIEDLLAYTLTGKNSTQVLNQEVDLASLTRQVTKDQKLAIASKALEMQLEIPPTIISGDGDKLRLVLDNLLSNAVKHSPEGGTVRVQLRQSANQAVLDVVDDGPGIPDSERDKVFDAFYQGSATYTGHVQGTGLGLAIAREMVTAHRGSISALSSSCGAHLQVRLPMHAAGGA